MTDTPRAPYLGRYLVVLILVMIGFAVLGWGLLRFAGIAIPGGAVAIVPPMVAALHVGQTWGRERGEIPDNRTAWRWSLIAGLVFLALQLVTLPLVLATLTLSPDVIQLFVILIGGTTIMSVLVHRFFLTIGAKGAIAGPRA
ncbi:ABZJ_00895 family protein [Jannaschia sp. 2305UL9-9]|uniref:ABZJ_00895 family protein n=1 Tax=Jannaschia sp. 2305UL9-9 TaxID=3121638 RepID=UPI00352748E5